jgi:hypothetical protein
LRHGAFDARLDILHPLALQRHQARDAFLACLLRRAAVERRRGVVLQAELDRLRHFAARELRREREPEIDPRRDAAPGDPVAIAHDALGHRLGAEARQVFAPHPVAGGLVAVQQPGRAEHQRAIAD